MSKKSEPIDKELYNTIKKEVWETYEKPSAYRSGQLVKRYKEAGGTFKGEKDKNTPLNRWFLEKWTSDKGTTKYPFKNSVYRPTIRITKDTPATFSELTPEDLKRAKTEKYMSGRVKTFKL
jgi:hypothetical protein